MKNIISILIASILFSCQSEPPIPEVYTLSTSANPPEGGSVSPSNGDYDGGSSVSLRAVANQNYIFSSWSGNATGAENPLNIEMDGNKNITANFVLADDDGDGVTNSLDQCNNTPSGENVNSSGCSSSQIDTDGDGVNNNIDQDNNTRSGVPVDEIGVVGLVCRFFQNSIIYFVWYIEVSYIRFIDEVRSEIH